ncbi:hypothetical protein L915_06888 [Phytophthora nicotianae]|uniref:RxLR effector protein n=1 Tax=Phytophthora nicotianae TaxID=4792 RepID=W2H310_PHYNI|nr:hypothetical protein L915_06888 [Phytophthora nicotianae]
MYNDKTSSVWRTIEVGTSKLHHLVVLLQIARPLLEDFATVEKLTPTEAATKWGIWTLFKTKSMEELANHPDYLLWKVYTKYWNKYHYSPA